MRVPFYADGTVGEPVDLRHIQALVGGYPNQNASAARAKIDGHDRGCRVGAPDRHHQLQRPPQPGCSTGCWEQGPAERQRPLCLHDGKIALSRAAKSSAPILANDSILSSHSSNPAASRPVSST